MKRFDGERGKGGPQLLPEVFSLARGGSMGCRSGLGWLQLMPMQREAKPRASVLCYKWSGVVLVWGPPAASSGFGDTDEQRQSRELQAVASPVRL